MHRIPFAALAVAFFLQGLSGCSRGVVSRSALRSGLYTGASLSLSLDADAGTARLEGGEVSLVRQLSRVPEANWPRGCTSGGMSYLE